MAGCAEASGEGESPLQGTEWAEAGGEDEGHSLTRSSVMCGRGLGGGAVEVGWAGSWKASVPAEKLGLNYIGVGSHRRV